MKIQVLRRRPRAAAGPGGPAGPAGMVGPAARLAHLARLARLAPQRGTRRRRARHTTAHLDRGRPRPRGVGPGPVGCQAAAASAAGQSKSPAGIMCMGCARRGTTVATPTTCRAAGRRARGRRRQRRPLQSRAPARLRTPSPRPRTWRKPPWPRAHAPCLGLALRLNGASLKLRQTMPASELSEEQVQKAGRGPLSLSPGSPTGAAGPLPCRARRLRGSSWLWALGSRFAAMPPWGSAFVGSAACISTERYAICVGGRPCTPWMLSRGQTT